MVPPGSRAADPQAVGLTPAQLAIGWVLQNHQVCTTVVGATDPVQVAENAEATGRELPFDVLLQIDQLLGRIIRNDPRLTIPAPV